MLILFLVINGFVFAEGNETPDNNKINLFTFKEAYAVLKEKALLKPNRFCKAFVCFG